MNLLVAKLPPVTVLLLFGAVLVLGSQVPAQDTQPRTEVHLYRNAMVEEGGSGVEFEFTVSAEVTDEDAAGPPTVSIPVRVWLVEGTAKEGVDFVPASREIEFAPSDYVPGRHSLYIARKEVDMLEIIDDDEEEGDESLGVTMELLESLPFVSLHPGSPLTSYITIIDDDGEAPPPPPPVRPSGGSTGFSPPPEPPPEPEPEPEPEATEEEMEEEVTEEEIEEIEEVIETIQKGGAGCGLT